MGGRLTREADNTAISKPVDDDAYEAFESAMNELANNKLYTNPAMQKQLKKMTDDKETEWMVNNPDSDEVKDFYIKIEREIAGLDTRYDEYSKKIETIENIEQRIGKVWRQKVGKEYNRKQEKDWIIKKERVIESISEDFNLDQFAASDMYDTINNNRRRNRHILPKNLSLKSPTRTTSNTNQMRGTNNILQLI